MKSNRPIVVGATVRLKRKFRGRRNHKGTAKVEALMNDIEGGVVLDRKLDGFKFWNVSDLETVVSWRGD